MRDKWDLGGTAEPPGGSEAVHCSIVEGQASDVGFCKHSVICCDGCEWC